MDFILAIAILFIVGGIISFIYTVVDETLSKNSWVRKVLGWAIGIGILLFFIWGAFKQLTSSW
jgi:hypothetical protein